MKRIIDPNPADDGECRTQEGWNKSFNRKGKAMISPPDVYQAPDSVLPSLRQIFNKYLFLTNTRIIYNPNDLIGRIVHNFGSKVVEPTEKQLVIPAGLTSYNSDLLYSDEQIEKVAKREGLKYLQALFETDDAASKLIGRLERISEKEAKDIRIWTPSQVSRRNYSERVVSFIRIGDSFYVGGDPWFCGLGSGRSWGVSVKAEKEN